MPKSSFYLVLLFLHLLSVVAAFASASLIQFGMFRLRGSQHVGVALDGAALVRRMGPIMPLISLVLAITGGALTSLAFSWRTPWIVVGFVALLAMQVIGGAAVKPRLMAIGARLGKAMSGGPGAAVDAETRSLILAPRLWTALQLQPMLALGIMCLMVFKPALGASIGVMVAFAALGAAIAVPCWRVTRTPAAQPAMARSA